MRHVWVTLATFFHLGRSPIAPGTVTSLATVLLVYFIKPYWQAPAYVHIIAVVLVFLIGIPASFAAMKHFNKKDPGACTIDEVAGQMLSLLFIPHTVAYYAAGFVLFRVFDILKPFPVNTAEKVPGGYGIMLDDIVAGLYALGILQLYRYFFA
ncbi:MAG: phosphatidylglycerophosphatase A [bacterium]|nr:phosphatidylglycerophosphatase A [bacterium]